VSTIVIDGLNEEDFRRSIENRLREGMAAAAIERLRPLLAPYCAPGGMLPERFLTVGPGDLVLGGWDALGDAVKRRDLPGRRITALSVAFAWPGDDAPAPDEQGLLQPHVEVSYFSDNAYPFSLSMREDLLVGYSLYGCAWSGDSEATDNALTLSGIDDLHGALAMLESQLLDCEEPDEDGIRAGSLGACLLSALLVQAVNERVARDGLPRSLCVMAGSNGVYPYFDAPVAGMPEVSRKVAEAREEAIEASVDLPAPRYSSLLMTGIPRAKKRAVLVLDESTDEMDGRIARLRGLNHRDEELDDAANDELLGEAPGHDGPAPDEGIIIPVAESPLLTKKPGKPAWDFRDMLGPGGGETQVVEAPPPPSAPREPVQAEPAGQHPVSPGFQLLEPDLQQRLQQLLAGQALAAPETAWPETHIAQPEALVQPDTVAEPTQSEAPAPRTLSRAGVIITVAPAHEGPADRLFGRIRAWLARLRK
jgi:hypothetical protein